GRALMTESSQDRGRMGRAMQRRMPDAAKSAPGFGCAQRPFRHGRMIWPLTEQPPANPARFSPTVELRGEIGRILRLAGGAALADADPEWLCSVKVVAGA